MSPPTQGCDHAVFYIDADIAEKLRQATTSLLPVPDLLPLHCFRPPLHQASTCVKRSATPHRRYEAIASRSTLLSIEIDQEIFSPNLFLRLFSSMVRSSSRFFNLKLERIMEIAIHGHTSCGLLHLQSMRLASLKLLPLTQS